MVSCFSYWLLPVLSGSVWLGMLMGMLIGWAVDTHREHYVSMDDNQTVAYISDIGASPKFKPMFIALCVVTTVTLDLSFLADRWLRHAGRLTPNGSTGQKVLGVLTIVFALLGTAGLILLSVFDVAHHKRLHDGFLLLFLGGYVLSAICICWEYQRLGIHNRHLRILSISFWVKLSFVLVEVVLAIIFVSLTFTHHTTGGAIVEWIIAFIFALYVFSFCIDLYPAVRTRHLKGRYREKHGPNGSGSDGPNSSATTGGTAMAQDGDNYYNPGNSHTAGPGEMEAANGSYRGYTANANAAPPTAPGSTGYYDNTYGESAARATRSPRTNNLAGNTFVEDEVNGGSQPLNQPRQTYQPSRSYQ
ncbi:fk506 suppressor [Sporothrix schenckii 1099-18]|uniref:CWH43-like N-terminal domain-containing protein n=2 Tax=Sporothrix schenckii TaxID=29908 RepID=U7Q7G2_SPOS1|nr:fk506 suppressor [Sporothrix schenckii 1099-18]ERT03147.1 hypothetical protein HMPREF1624_01452 [Sporothrix schenckii ATCC 58251]KJR84442.1 fk506 suppressor [Sporothrix schenckii 1099-18]